MKDIKIRWQQVREAKRNCKNAYNKLNITDVEMHECFCINNLVSVVVGDLYTVTTVCDKFKSYEICKEESCPCHANYMDYVDAKKQYTELRGKFFADLFHRTRK